MGLVVESGRWPACEWLCVAVPSTALTMRSSCLLQLAQPAGQGIIRKGWSMMAYSFSHHTTCRNMVSWCVCAPHNHRAANRPRDVWPLQDVALLGDCGGGCGAGRARAPRQVPARHRLPSRRPAQLRGVEPGRQAHRVHDAQVRALGVV